MARTSYEDDLALERSTDRRHEWVDGVAHVMEDSTIAHSQLAAQVIGEFGRILGDRPFSVHAPCQRVRGTRFASYPDVTVVCGDVQVADDDPNAIVNPVALVEVLSDSTETWDRGGKFRRYRKFESLRDYVLVSQHERCIEVYSRDEDGEWRLREAADGESVALSSLGGAIEVDRVYRGVTLTPVPARGRVDEG